MRRPSLSLRAHLSPSAHPFLPLAQSQRRADALLVVAAAQGYVGDVEALLNGKAGEPTPATPAARDKRGTPALHFAAGGDRVGVIECLWSRGADAEAEDANGRTALHYAAAGGAAAAAAFLAARAGAWVGAPGPGDDSPLHLAARSGDAGTVGALVDRASAADLRDRNARGLTPLGEALLGGAGGAPTSAATTLMASSAAVGAVDVPASHGWTLLHLAAAAGRAPAVELLLGKGGIDAKTGRARNAGGAGAGAASATPPPPLTPLHAAALGGSAASVRALLGAGADAMALDSDGRAPADVAPAAADDVRRLLAAAGAAVRADNKKVHAPAAAGPAGPAPSTDAGRPSEVASFLALPHPARLALARKWAALDDDAALGAATSAFPPSARRLAGDARELRHARAVTVAIAALHDDDDFQDGARLERVKGAVAAVRADPRAASAWAGDFEAMAVLVGLRRLQAVCASNGRLSVPFEKLVVRPGTSAAVRAEDAATLAELGELLDRHLAALVAAAGGADERTASAAAAAVLGAAAARLSSSKPDVSAATDTTAVAVAAAAEAVAVVAPAAPQAPVRPPPAAAATRSLPPPSMPSPPRDALIPADPAPLSPPLTPGAPDPDVTPWASMRRDLPRALGNSAARSLAAVLISWMVMMAINWWKGV